MPEFCITAADGCVPLDVLAFIAAAVDLQMRRDVAPVFRLGEPWTVGAISSLDGVRDAQNVRKILTFRPKLSVAGALGFHSERFGIDYAEALPPRVDGSTIDGTTVSHEVLETFFDPGCDLAFLMPDNSRVDGEICDPCEADSYPEVVSIGNENRVVLLSNFVFPSWFGLGGEGPFDLLGKIKAPFQLAPGGYMRVVNVGGDESFVFADEQARGRVEAKLSNATSRVARRKRA